MNDRAKPHNLLSPELEKLNDAILAAGAILTHYFGKHLQLTHKSTTFSSSR